MANTATKSYGLGRFILDFFLGFITGGIWWIYLLFKFFRRNS